MIFTGICLAIGVVTWVFSAIKFQADMGLMLTFMFLWNMLGALVLLFAVTRVIWINAVLLFGAGACMVMVFAVLSSLVQLIVPNEMRGRVMSIYMVAFRGGMPLGSLVAGYVATFSSASMVLTINGVLMSLVAAWFLVKHDAVREI